MMNFFERYLIELILLGGFLLAGPLARIIAGSAGGDPGEDKNRDYAFIRSVFQILFAALIVLWLLLFKTLAPLMR